jgi:transcriptional regulator with XRE-family HTH domain
MEVMPRTLHKRTNYFGRFIKKRRTELSLFQKDVAKALGVTAPEFVGAIENGSRMPNFERLPDLAKVLKLSVIEIMQMAFTDIYPSLVPYLSDTAGEGEGPALHIGRKIYQLPRTERQTIIKMVNELHVKIETEPVRKKA